MKEPASAERNDDGLVLTGIGLVTPVGHDSISSAAAIRAGISRFQEIPDYATSSGAKVAGGLASGLTDDRSGSDRLLAMAIPAAKEALFSAEEFCESLDPSTTRLILCVGASERPAYETFDDADVAALLEGMEAKEFTARAEIVAEGHAGGVRGIQRACELLRSREVRACIIGAVDSLVEYPALDWLEESGRLKTDDRPDGFMPGEAAAFLVIESRSDARRRGAGIIADMIAPSTAQEKAHVLSQAPSHGQGLAQAIEATLGAAGTTVDGIICDLNGEYHRSKEWSLAMPRVFEGYPRIPDLWHPAECIGDVGSASAGAFVALAARASGEGYLPGPSILIWTSSDAGCRGSVLVKGVRNA